MFFLQLLIVLIALYVGSRYGSLALGTVSGIALAVLVPAMGLRPGAPPTDVIYIIVAAVTCAGMLQASGGMDWLVQIAERLLRRHPEHITVYAPLCTFFLTVLVGTGHVVYTLMPIIADIALRRGIRPERPCAVASVASQVGITCSPIAAAVVAFATISAAHGFPVTIPQILLVSLPSCVVGILAAAACSYHRGKDLGRDPLFQARLRDEKTRAYMYGSEATTLDRAVPASARRAVYIFLGAIAVIVTYASVPALLPTYALADGSGSETLRMNIVIQIVMLTAAALMTLCCRADPRRAIAGSVWQSGMVAVVAIFGVAWMADTLFGNYMTDMQTLLASVVTRWPWAIAAVFFTVSVLINSQGAVVVAMLPLAYALGIPGPVLLGALPAVYGYFFLPNYPSDLATVNFDRSGTTVIGRYLLNHSFMMPGLVSVGVSTVVAMLLVQVLY